MIPPFFARRTEQFVRFGSSFILEKDVFNHEEHEAHEGGNRVAARDCGPEGAGWLSRSETRRRRLCFVLFVVKKEILVTKKGILRT
jgi:hypothetical protein